MQKKIKDISEWLINQGIEITREVLEEKLEEAYKQGKMEMREEIIEGVLKDIRYNIRLKIKKKKQILYERDFYIKPPEKDIVEMRAMEYLEDNIDEFIKSYSEEEEENKEN